MKDTLKVNLADIKIQDVGATCIMLVSKFSRAIKAKHGVVIQLRDPQVLNKVAAYASATGSDELKLINSQIEEEIRRHLTPEGTPQIKHIVFAHQPLPVKKKIQSRNFRRI